MIPNIVKLFVCATLLGSGYGQQDEPPSQTSPSVPPAAGRQQPSEQPASASPIQTENRVMPTILGAAGSSSTPKYDAFRALATKMRNNQRQINELYRTMPIGFPEQQAQRMKQINALKKENLEIPYLLKDAAIEVYIESPNKYPAISEIMLQAANYHLLGTEERFPYDPHAAWKILDLMIQNNAEMPQVYFFAMQTQFALQDFEKARQMFDKLKEMGQDVNEQYAVELDAIQQKWEREQELRHQEAAADDLPRVKIETTAGEMVVELFENQAPETVANFISLVEQGFYDDLPFHMVKQGIFAQTGCPNGNGQGDPGYRIYCEIDNPEIRHHFTGTLSMANAGKDTGGSQFFITIRPRKDFDGRFTAFGRAIEGLDVIYKLVPADATQPVSVDQDQRTKMTRLTVIRKRDHEYLPRKVTDQPAPVADDGSVPAATPDQAVDNDNGSDKNDDNNNDK